LPFLLCLGIEDPLIPDLAISGVLPPKPLDLGDWQDPRKGLSGTGLSSGVAGEPAPGLD